MKYVLSQFVYENYGNHIESLHNKGFKSFFKFHQKIFLY